MTAWWTSAAAAGAAELLRVVGDRGLLRVVRHLRVVRRERSLRERHDGAADGERAFPTAPRTTPRARPPSPGSAADDSLRAHCFYLLPWFFELQRPRWRAVRRNTPLYAHPFRSGETRREISYTWTTGQFRILGPLEARVGDRVIPLPRRSTGRSSACSPLRAGEVVSADALIEELWGGRPPRTARDALHNNVSLLRKTLGADVDRDAREPGYVLHVAPEQVDLCASSGSCEEARADRHRRGARGQAPRRRSQLWRGAPLADLAYEQFAAVEIGAAGGAAPGGAGGPDRRRARARPQRRPRARARDARPGASLRRAAARAADARALPQPARQADALDAYREARRELVEELGLEPGRRCGSCSRRSCGTIPRSTPRRPCHRSRQRRKTVTVLFAELVDSSA